jgi:hypothetical protein
VEQTRQLGRLLGVPLRFEEMSREEARAGLGRRCPEPVVEALPASAERQRAGAKARVDGAVSTLIGRPAGTFRQWARDHLEAFAPVTG